MEESVIQDLSVPDKQKIKLYKIHFIKNGRIFFKEERLLTENHKQVAQAIIKFREWRATFESSHSKVSAADIPKPFTDLIALLAHESEDENLDILSVRVNGILRPFDHNIDIYTPFSNAIKQIIKVTAHQERYGLADIVLLLNGSPLIMPKRLTMHRWQAYDTSKFPLEIKNIAIKRREKRKKFSKMFTDSFQSLSEVDRINLLNDENGNFINSIPVTKIDKKPKQIKKTIFEPYKESKYTVIQSKGLQKGTCSSFDTLLYVGLNNSFDLRKQFLNELSPNSKRKRGIRHKNIQIDMRKVWINSITTTRKTKQDEEMYKNIRLLKMKLLQFYEDVRPAYFGTWTKVFNENNIINGRKPFAKDTQTLNYDYDSEAEWDHDVDCDDIHTLDPDEDDDMLLLDSADEEDSALLNDEDEVRWVVPEGYLSDDEGIHDKKKSSSTSKNHSRIVSRPVKWPISANKHFPMKSVVIGPSFESAEEPDNHPLSDFKIHFLVNLESDCLGYSPFDIIAEDSTSIDNTTNGETTNKTPLPVYFESSKLKTPLFQREIDEIIKSNKQELVNIILENKAKTMMGLVLVLKSTKIFSEFTTSQLQAMVHDIAIQEIRDSNKEYNWYLRGTPSSALS